MGRLPGCSKEEMNKGAWTAQEDKILKDFVTVHGEKKWSNVAKENRCGKSCRLRWLNYLRPDIKRGNISSAEEDLIIRLTSSWAIEQLFDTISVVLSIDCIASYFCRWSLIAGRLPGRTDYEIKNYWHTILKPSNEITPSTKSVSNVEKIFETPQSNQLEPSDDGCLVNDSIVNEWKSNDQVLSIFPEDDYSPNFSSSFNYMDELLMSDVSDSEFWKLCMFYDNVEEG
ncbi:transcription factor MYB303A1 [Fagus crenata]